MRGFAFGWDTARLRRKAVVAVGTLAAATAGLLASAPSSEAEFGLVEESVLLKSHGSIPGFGGYLIHVQEPWVAGLRALPEVSQAGAHPDGTASFKLNTIFPLPPTGANQLYRPDGALRDALVDTPEGFLGNPEAVSTCDIDSFLEGAKPTCPANSAAGYVTVAVGDRPGVNGTTAPIYRLPAPPGYPAAFAFRDWGGTAYYVLPKLDPARNYALSVGVRNLPDTALPVMSTATMYGNPFAPVNVNRIPAYPGTVNDIPRAFLINPTHCSGERLETKLRVRSWQEPDRWSEKAVLTDEPVTGCDKLQFGTAGAPATLGLQPTGETPDAPTGLTARLRLPYNDNPNGLANPTLRDTVVEFPDGMTVNAAAGDGLEGCTPDQIGLKTDRPVACPDGSKLGTVRVKTPLLQEELPGTLYQAMPFDNPFDSLIAVYLVVRHDARGILIKVPGRVDLDHVSGKLTATFRDNPQLPFTELDVQVKSGPRAPLATPRLCGSYESTSTLTPWSHPQSGPPAVNRDPFQVAAGDGRSCVASLAERPLGLEFSAGTISAIAGTPSDFAMRLARRDGDQELDRVDVMTPKGLSGSIRDVPYCPEAGIAQAVGRTAAGDGRIEMASPSCPEASRVGTTTVGAGTGSSPLFVPGKVYLAGAYKGAPLSLVFVVPAVAGPFDLGVQTVRVALNVDRRTAQISALSDEIPKILEGIPLRIKDVRVDMDRRGFVQNPTSCDEKQIASTVHGTHGARGEVGSRFQVGDCAALGFKPKLTMRLTGRKQVRTGKHPGIRAQVTQRGAEAGIGRAKVTLPKSLALDVNNAQALCEFEDGTKPDLEKHCPAGSIVGKAVARTPLLKRPLEGNVYFVKNVRRDPKTGNAIRTLPMIIAALRGEVAINLVGESDTTKAGRLVNTFAEVPDAPVSRFNLNINGGKNGIIAVTRTRRALINLCARPKSHVADADMDGHNGKVYDRDVRMKTPCSKRQVKKAQRAQARKASRS